MRRSTGSVVIHLGNTGLEFMTNASLQELQNAAQ